VKFEIVPAAAVPLDEQARLANAAFAGYVGGWVEMDAISFARFLMIQGADLFHSRLVRVNGTLAGFGYITRTANVVRLSGMALIPAARGTGAAAELLLRLFAEAQENRDEAMILEVIEQNPRAIALYRRHGFREITRLVGWRRSVDEAPAAGPMPPLQPMPVLEALRSSAVREYPEIPWPISRHAIARVPKTSAFSAGDVRVVISDTEATPLRIHGLLSASGDWDELRAAVGALTALFPERELFAPPIWPEEYGANLFEPLGFKREPISQFLMRRDF
jgi:ribosomal protein S18 acetylase RimI-like enzyme